MLSLFLLGATGCGGHFYVGTVSYELTWSGDGNPSVPACGAASSNCKDGFVVRDDQGRKIAALPLGARSYVAPGGANCCEVHVTGRGEDGKPIESACCVTK